MTAPVALITGAADGIGWAAAQAFAGAGHRVVLADLRAEAAVARALELGPDHIGVGCDVGDEADVAACSTASAAHAAASTLWSTTPASAVRTCRRSSRARTSSSGSCASI